jgi:nucleotide-binding universal stress UspA family protein
MVMKSVLVAIDNTPAAGVARRLAYDLAGRFSAHVTGVAVVDTDDIKGPEPVPLGAGAFAHARRKRDMLRISERRARMSRTLATFQRIGTKLGLEVRVATLESDTIPAFLRLAQAHDVVALGRDTEFHFEGHEPGLSTTVERLVSGNPRPVMVTPSRPRVGKAVIVAYDGSVASARAMQMATLLGLLNDAPVHMVTVARQRSEAANVAQFGHAFLARHNLVAKIHSEAFDPDPATTLLERANSLGARLLVMGAYGHRGWREMLFGSCTRRLLRESPVPLFIYH